MAKNELNAKELPVAKDLITDTQECVKHIQHLLNSGNLDTNVDNLVSHIKAVVDKELWQPDENSSINYNQVVVNVAFRCYYQLLKKYNLNDILYGNFMEQHFTKNVNLKEQHFIMLQSILLTNSSLEFSPEVLVSQLVKALVRAIDSNHVSLLSILKVLNLLLKKFPLLNFDVELSLDHVYFCLQSNQMGMRDEGMSLLQVICLKRPLALRYFNCVVNYWPWTNRSKLFLLGCILNKHNLYDLLQECGSSKEDFYLGLRSTLNYKNLLAASQYVIKALSAQKSAELLEMSVNILTVGNKKEMENLYAQWFSRIQQKYELFELLQQKPEIVIFIENSSAYLMDSEHSYRLILIFSMFSKQVFHLSKLHFFKLSTELLTNCFQYDTECQLLIFKFVVDNLANFAIEDCIEFVQLFLKTHCCVDNAQFRNCMLNKMPHIINYIAKTFCKLCLNSEQTSSLQSSILNFFVNLHKDVDQGIANEIYQPKIFSLKLLEILLKSLYMDSLTKNAKNCSLTQNQQLSLFLKHRKIFDKDLMALRLIELLNDPLGFDDALDLIVQLIKLIQPQNVAINLALDLSQNACTLADVDACNLSYLYARVALQNCCDEQIIKEFFIITMANLKIKLELFNKDPLLCCKTQEGHLFGQLNVLNELVVLKPECCASEFFKILKIVEQIQDLIIKKLNLAVLEHKEEVLAAASFEDMDKSLEMLINQSAYNSENHELCRKYVLMSFWLTLKANCDLASSMVNYIVKSNMTLEQRSSFLQKCLQTHVMVLTKCRHKGAIEAAGVSIGKLTKSITSYLDDNTNEYNLLHQSLKQLYQVKEANVSTTRRGAGFSIMFLHIVKNEEHRHRPLLKRAVENLLNPSLQTSSAKKDLNCDRLEALHLHFLCVLVRDTELRPAMSKYYNEIMEAAVKQIDNTEWTICNAALQLFGALVPKIVGQKKAHEFENPLLWEPSEITFSEINRKLPKACTHLLKYCLTEKCSTRTIILFLEFLHKVEYIYKDTDLVPEDKPICSYKQSMWCLLKHCSEKVRLLAAKCFIRSHEFRVELPKMLNQVTSILFSIKNENFFEGLVYVLHEGILKLRHDSRHIIGHAIYLEIEQQIIQNLQETLPSNNILYKFFTLCKVWDLFNLLKDTLLIQRFKDLVQTEEKLIKMLGHDLWLERTQAT